MGGGLAGGVVVDEVEEEEEEEVVVVVETMQEVSGIGSHAVICQTPRIRQRQGSKPSAKWERRMRGERGAKRRRTREREGEKLGWGV